MAHMPEPSYRVRISLCQVYEERTRLDRTAYEGHSGRRKTASSGVDLNAMKALIEQACSPTSRQIATIMDCSKSTVENIMEHCLKCETSFL